MLTAHHPLTHTSGGSGLGLFISRRLTEMHGGAIGVASRPKVGSTFSFYIKARRAITSPGNANAAANADLSIRTTASALSNRSRDSRDKPPPLGRKFSEDRLVTSQIHVLIVEDNLVNQRVLAKQLRHIGMKVDVANHGGEAIDFLRTTTCCRPHDPSANRLSLILMDWEMPVMDGLTCVRAIRKLQVQGEVKSHVPVIGVTANVRSEQVAEALESGMDDVISKPFRIPELCACIWKTIERTGPSEVRLKLEDGDEDEGT